MTEPGATSKGYALITGAGQGIGRAIALELALRGFGILATARSQASLKEVVMECGALNGGRATAIAVDLFEADAMDRLVDATRSLPEPLTALVNNAGQAFWGCFEDVSMDDHRKLMRLNVEVPLELTHRLLPVLRVRPESYILMVSSLTAYSAVATLATYSGSKAFLLRFGRSLRLELKDTGVNVCCVCPGTVLTGFTQRANMQAMDDLAKRFGKPPGPIARAAVDAMLAGRAEVVPGFLDRTTSWFMKLFPDALVERVASNIYLKRLPKRET
ncbi:MAG: SDR family NAD(P)-dependent oxidoreductase [Flavobacteriales bacterium]|nr:SDR family NAD(P)-dependent oxidoreductase [Flavobacteriales bacterium]